MDNWIFEEPMPIDRLHGFLLKPHNLTEKEFWKVAWFMGLTKGKFLKRIVGDVDADNNIVFDQVFDAFIRTDFFDSNGAIRRMAKNGGVFLGNKPVKDGVVFTEDMFHLTGVIDHFGDFLTFCVARKGKKDFEIFFSYRRLVTKIIEQPLRLF